MIGTKKSLPGAEVGYSKILFLLYPQEHKFIRVQPSFHHGKQHGLVRSVGKCDIHQN